MHIEIKVGLTLLTAAFGAAELMIVAALITPGQIQIGAGAQRSRCAIWFFAIWRYAKFRMLVWLGIGIAIFWMRF